MYLARQKENNNNLASAIRQSLGFLPSILLKKIIEDKILSNQHENNFPVTFSLQTSCLYIDMSHFWDQNIKSNNINNSINENSNTIKINSFVNINKQISPEFFYFCMNRYYERLISTITNHGGDVIFQGHGLYAIWPPDESNTNCLKFIENNNKNIIKRKNSRNFSKKENAKNEKNEIAKNLCAKAILCALEIQKKSIMEINQGCSFKSKIGMSFGECKFNIVNGQDEKFDYFITGDAIYFSFSNAKKDYNGGQIIINEKIYRLVLDIFEAREFIDNNEKFSLIIRSKIKINQFFINKSTANLIKNNFSLEQIVNKSNNLRKFNSYIVSDIFQKNAINEKWLREIRSITLIFLRIKLTKQEMDNPNKLQKIYILIQEISENLGGVIHKLITENNGIMIVIAFGISFISSGQNELMGALASLEICSKLKKLNIIPFIGLSSGLAFYGLCGTVGGRREWSIFGNLYVMGLLCVGKVEEINEKSNCKSGNDYILMDEKTMLLIDNRIPCKFCLKIYSGNDSIYNLYVPFKVKSMIHKHSESNLFPLIGGQTNSNLSDNQYYKDYINSKNIIYLEKNMLDDCVKNINDYINDKSKIKLININGLLGCGKTLFLKKVLDSFFVMNPKLREILCNTHYGNDYSFIFSSNLLFTMNTDILSESDREDYRGIQLILKEIFNAFYNETQNKSIIINLIKKNNCFKFVSFLEKIFEVDDISTFIENNQEEQIEQIDESVRKNLHLFFIDLINEYKNFILDFHKDYLLKYKLSLPIFIIIEDLQICDDITKDFINYYLTQNINNSFLIITTSSIPIFPPYKFLSRTEKDPFNEYNSNSEYIKKYNLTVYDTEDKVEIFAISILNELRKQKEELSYISKEIILFLLYKTFCGIPEFIKELLISIYDQKLVYVKSPQQELVATSEFQKMIEYNDFTELNIPEIIQKRVGYIIDNYLDEEEKYILKIATILGDLFDLTQLKIIVKMDNSMNFSMDILKDSNEYYLYDLLYKLQQKNFIEILNDLDIKKKHVVCKFSVPFLREVLYHRTLSEQRNQLHYLVAKIIGIIKTPKKDQKKYRYMSNEKELGILENHLKYCEASINENLGTTFNNDINKDNLNINNLKILINKRLCTKISQIKINDDKHNMIKAGYIYKKSDGKLTWEYRYLVLTTNRVIYYYNEEDYKTINKDPLGIFYLQNLILVRLITDGSVDSKKNIIELNVNEWIKKGEMMKQRVYSFRVEDREEAYKWLITFNILKMQAFYENYCMSYGRVNFPLYNTKKNEIIIKQKKLKFANIIPDAPTLAKKSKLPSKRKSIFSPYFTITHKDVEIDSQYENYLLKKSTLQVRYLVKYCLFTLFNKIQYGLSKNSKDFEERNIDDNILNMNKYLIYFTSPKNLDSKENSIFYIDTDVLNKNLKNLKKRYEKSKNINIYSIEIKKDYTKQQLLYFKKFYPEHFRKPNEPLIEYTTKKIKTDKKRKTKKVSTHVKFLEIVENNDNSLSFSDIIDQKKDEEDYLRYLEYMDKNDRNTSSNKSARHSIVTKSKGSMNSRSNLAKMNCTDSEKNLSLFNKQNNGNTPILESLKKLCKIKKKKRKSEDTKNMDSSSLLSSSRSNSNNNCSDELVNDKNEKDSSDSIENSIEKKLTKKKSIKSKKKSIIKKFSITSQKKEVNKSQENIKFINNTTPIKQNSSYHISRNPSLKIRKSLSRKIPYNTINQNSPIFSSKRSSIKNSNSIRNNNSIKNSVNISNNTQQQKENDFYDLLLGEIDLKKSMEAKNNNSKAPLKSTVSPFSISNSKKIITYEDEIINSLNLNDDENKICLNNGSFKGSSIPEKEKEKEKENENEKEKEKENFDEIKISLDKKIYEESSSNKLLEKNTSNQNNENSLNAISSIENYVGSKDNFASNNLSMNYLINTSSIYDLDSNKLQGKISTLKSYSKHRSNINLDNFSLSSKSSQNLNNNISYNRSSKNIYELSKKNTGNLSLSKSKSETKLVDLDKNNKLTKRSSFVNKDVIDNNDYSYNTINKLKNLNMSLKNEKKYSLFFKNIKKEEKDENTNIAVSSNNLTNNTTNYCSNNSNNMFINSKNYNYKRSRNKKNSTKSNSCCTKSSNDYFYYPNVFYINEINTLHTKTHVSDFFTKLRKKNKNDNL